MSDEKVVSMPLSIIQILNETKECILANQECSIPQENIFRPLEKRYLPKRYLQNELDTADALLMLSDQPCAQKEEKKRMSTGERIDFFRLKWKLEEEENQKKKRAF